MFAAHISIYLSTYLSIYPSIYLSISISISISIYIYLSLSISIYLYLYLSLSISIYLYLSLSIAIYLYLSLSISIYLYLSLSIYLSWNVLAIWTYAGDWWDQPLAFRVCCTVFSSRFMRASDPLHSDKLTDTAPSAVTRPNQGFWGVFAIKEKVWFFFVGRYPKMQRKPSSWKWLSWFDRS